MGSRVENMQVEYYKSLEPAQGHQKPLVLHPPFWESVCHRLATCPHLALPILHVETG
jgi:hypothetical protein